MSRKLYTSKEFFKDEKHAAGAVTKTGKFGDQSIEIDPTVQMFQKLEDVTTVDYILS